MDNYYSNLLAQFQDELETRFVNNQGQDITPVIRGKIFVIKQILNLKYILENHDKIQESLRQAAQKIQNKGVA